jgi:hypothetical protein
MPVVATSRYNTAGNVLQLVRSLLNDPNGVLFSDTLLFPFLNGAYRGLQEELGACGVTLLVGYAAINLPLTTANGQTLAPNPPQISDQTTPQLPIDLIVPLTLSEQATGSTDLFTPMEKITGEFPNLQPMPYLRIWQWQADQILLIGATQAITVNIRYQRALPQLALETDPVQIPYANKPLAYETAAFAARSRGVRDLAMDLEQMADRSRGVIIERYSRAEQYKPRRKKPYGYRRRVIYL